MEGKGKRERGGRKRELQISSENENIKTDTSEIQETVIEYQ